MKRQWPYIIIPHTYNKTRLRVFKTEKKEKGGLQTRGLLMRVSQLQPQPPSARHQYDQSENTISIRQ